MDEIKERKKGIIAFWTLKNPNFPERIIYTESSVTCCEFSKKNPNLIAVGDSMGNISIRWWRGFASCSDPKSMT